MQGDAIDIAAYLRARRNERRAINNDLDANPGPACLVFYIRVRATGRVIACISSDHYHERYCDEG